jgi:hypothetical protein
MPYPAAAYTAPCVGDDIGPAIVGLVSEVPLWTAPDHSPTRHLRISERKPRCGFQLCIIAHGAANRVLLQAMPRPAPQAAIKNDD